MKKQFRSVAYIFILSLSFSTLSPLIAVTAMGEKKSLFKAVADFKQLFDKCRKKQCTPQEEAKLRSQKLAIASIVSGIIALIGGTFLGIRLFKRHQQSQKKKEIMAILAEQRIEKENLRQQQERERLAFEREQKTKEERQEMLRRQEIEKQQLEELQRQQEQEERMRREQERIEQERIEQEREKQRRQAEEAARLQAQQRAEQKRLEEERRRAEQAEKARQKKMHDLSEKLIKELPLRVKTRPVYGQKQEVRKAMTTDMSNRMNIINQAFFNQNYEEAIKLLVEGFETLDISDIERERLGISPEQLRKLGIQ